MSSSTPPPPPPPSTALPSRVHGSHRPPSHHSHSTKQQPPSQPQPHSHHHHHHPHQHQHTALPAHHLTSLTPPPLPPPSVAASGGFGGHFAPSPVPHAPFPLFPAVPVAQPYGQSAFYHLFSLLISPSSLLSLLSPSPTSHRARSALFSALSSLLSPLCTVYPPFLFGSTPLHTYLPSGDLDVGMVVRAAAGEGAGVEGERVLLRVKEVLEEEERRWKNRKTNKQPSLLPPPLSHSVDDVREGETSSEESTTPSATDSPASSPSTVSATAATITTSSTVLPVHSVTFINASEVKLVKCMIGPILVDISTNTSAALATVCFLEEADREIDRSLLLHYPPVTAANQSSALPPSSSPPHLLKQSILLIKSWCLYESHILASHHSLLSTYCLETLVIYILNHYHCHLHHTAADPFVVLSLFMHVFAVYNWEEWGLSVTGPVRKDELQSPMFPPHHLFALERSTASVPPLLASPFPHANHPLLSPSFFYALYSAYSLPSPPPARPFLAKHMNVVDPLDLSNNLGRSVSFSNLWRVRLCLRKGASDMVRVLSEGRECVEAMLREMDEVSKRSASAGSGGMKGGKGRVWMEESEVLSEPAAFQHLMASLPTTAASTATPYLSIVCPSLPFSSSLLSRLSAHHQLVHSLFAHTWQHHTSIPRPDCHLVQRLREEGALVDDEFFRPLQDGEEKERATRPASTLSPTSASSSLSSTAASLSSEPLPSTLARRLLAMPSPPQSLSRDDSSLSLSLPPRAPASSRSLFISTLPHPTAARDVVAVSGTFSPLIEPSSCPPPSTTLSPRHSASCPPSPAPSVSPTLSPITSPSPSPSPPLSDPLASSLNALCQLFFPLKQIHLAALHSAYPAIAPPPFHPWPADGQRPFDGHRNGVRDRQQQQQQLQWTGKGQGKGKLGRAMRERADRREEKERELFHPPTSPASASPLTTAHFSTDSPHTLPLTAAHAGQPKRGKRNGFRQQQQHYLATAAQQQQQQHQQHHHVHGLPPPASFHMYPPPPAPYPQHTQHTVRRQYVNPVPQPPPYPPHGWHSVYSVPPIHHMQPPSTHSQPVVPVVVSPNLSPASPRSANLATAAAPAGVSRIHMLPGGVAGQVGVLQHVRSFLEADDARSFAAVMQPTSQQQQQQQHGRQHTRAGSGGATPPVVLDGSSGVVRKSDSPQKHKQRSRGQLERRAEVPSAPSASRPNRRRSDGEFPPPVGSSDELSQPAAFHSSTGASSGAASAAGSSSPSLSMARSWSTAVGSARASLSLSAVPLSLSSPVSSLSSPALPSLLFDPSSLHSHQPPWTAASPPVPSPPLQPPPAALLPHPLLPPAHSSDHNGVSASPVVSVNDVSGVSGSSGGVSGVGAVQYHYPGPPKGERRQKAKKERVVL